ncbi:circadian clock KaiB family protein [Polyangium mundeleinium]|uniref:Circadian clock KaiB family protein n=1 Tax=Polyangium mundeleinium TaxID=2995306 RepID=A0ABT5EFX5_9BACT|nr:circadian clock KaiB family protein [Polyangium mundeleinium]MDC0740219.1 circadian clock KaiB family protein [Polyangium mundeleinium]
MGGSDQDDGRREGTTPAASGGTNDSWEQALADNLQETYVLRLYVVGNSPRSRWAIRNVRRLCDEHLVGRFDLEVHDLNQEPWLARDAQIIAAPTLVRERPLPVQRLIGSLSDVQRVLVGLGLPPHEQGDP